MIAPEPLAALVARLDGEPRALIALGIPRCPACRLLPASLGALAAARPGLAVGLALLDGPEDWALRETLLWPRGIRVSRGSVPALALLREGRAVAARPGGGPAHVIDGWLETLLGPAARSLAPALTRAEERALAQTAPRRAQRLRARDPASLEGGSV